jgi:hypothetical protein
LTGVIHKKVGPIDSDEDGEIECRGDRIIYKKIHDSNSIRQSAQSKVHSVAL